ncbi:MAG TPA: zinc ribbon domain-containing protein [Clostridiales bacterium]|jgi:putative FmdB family regulatory protein|nr:zinc ribbon domain-containing protein [Clostridiales bacterium]
MPFYTFVCNSCGKKFEVRCTIAEKDSGSVVCPGCGANELDRIFEGFSVIMGNSGCESKCPAKTGGCPSQSGGCGGCCGR